MFDSIAAGSVHLGPIKRMTCGEGKASHLELHVNLFDSASGLEYNIRVGHMDMAINNICTL